VRVSVVILCLAVAASSGCSSHHGAKQKHLVYKLSTVPLPNTLPPNACFVGVLRYDVTLFAESQRPTDVCRRLARRYFPGTRHLPWSPSWFRAADVVGECDLSRHGVRLSVSRGDPDFEGPRFDRAEEVSRRVCAALHARGWKRTPNG